MSSSSPAELKVDTPELVLPEQRAARSSALKLPAQGKFLYLLFDYYYLIVFIASTENDEGGSGSDAEMAEEKEYEAEEAYSPSSIKPKSNFIFFILFKEVKTCI